MRVGILALLHESNTFIREPTTLDHFRENVLAVGDDVRARFADTHHEVGGFFEFLDQADGFEAVPLMAARAVPSGTVSSEAMDALTQMALEQLEAAGTLDGLLVAPHGATVSQSYPDADGHWLNLVRQRVGRDLPIVGTLDAHANLSPSMVEACNALVAYRTNPHLDQRARGVEAARLLTSAMHGSIHLTMAAAFPRLAINIERQLTSEAHCRPLYELADRQIQEPGVLSNSILLGFPYADVTEMGSAVIAVTDGDAELARKKADELGDYLWQHRHEFDAQLISIDDAIRQAVELPAPVCLLDMGDNVGGGSPGDGTQLLAALREGGVRSAGVLFDPESVRAAQTAGIGATVRLKAGGKTDPRHGQPLEGDYEVLALTDGKFTEPQPRHGGFTHCDQGPTAVVQGGPLTLVLTSLRLPPFSLKQLTSCNVAPAAHQVLVAKGVNAPVAAYAEVCDHLIRVNTPGVTTADMHALEYHHRRRPLFPFEK